MAEHRWRMKAKEMASKENPKPMSSKARRMPKGSCIKSGEFRRPLGPSNRLTQSADHTRSYVWRCPEEPLTERRSRADRRREELLQDIYQDNMATGGMEDLVKEWVELVMERDQLVKEQFNQDNRYFYFRELQRLLREQPPLGDGSEEVTIRETLLNLERCVTQYCLKNNMVLSPRKHTHQPSSHRSSGQPSQQAAHIPTSHTPQSGGHSNGDHSNKVHLEFYKHKSHILDLETGQTGIGDGHYLDQQVSISSCSLFDNSQSDSPDLPYQAHVPLADQLGKEHLQGKGALPTTPSGAKPLVTPSSQFSPYHHHHHGHHSHLETPSHIPPVSSTSPPPLPVTPPSSRPSLTQLPVGMFGSKGGRRGTSGTVQFAGMSFATAAQEEAGSSSADGGEDHYRNKRESNSTSEEEMTAPLAHKERKSLLMEISTVGQTGLKPTNRPRSPGGTPIRRPNSPEGAEQAGHDGGTSHNAGMISMNSPSYSHQQHQRNSDLLQKALFAKFRSLHSTPLGHKSSGRQMDYSNSFDFSSAWSDINSSVQVYDDPDISNTTATSVTVSPSSHQASRNKSAGSKHNASSAV